MDQCQRQRTTRLCSQDLKTRDIKKMKPCLHVSLTLHNISAQFNNEGLSQGEKYQYFTFYIDPRWPFLCQVQMTVYLCFNFLYLFSPTNSIFSPLFFV